MASLTLTGTLPSLTRSDLTAETGHYQIDLLNARVHDAPLSVLGASAGSDDLGITVGTWGTDDPAIRSSDANGTTVTQYARFQFVVPPEYVSAGSFVIRVRAGIVTTPSDTTSTIDLEVYKADKDSGLGSDLCATAAQTVNSTSKANTDFIVTSSGLAAGDKLLIRVTVALNDSGSGAGVIQEISEMRVLCDIKG